MMGCARTCASPAQLQRLALDAHPTLHGRGRPTIQTLSSGNGLPSNAPAWKRLSVQPLAGWARPVVQTFRLRTALAQKHVFLLRFALQTQALEALKPLYEKVFQQNYAFLLAEELTQNALESARSG